MTTDQIRPPKPVQQCAFRSGNAKLAVKPVDDARSQIDNVLAPQSLRMRQKAQLKTAQIECPGASSAESERSSHDVGKTKADYQSSD